jgi:hypothetical protein
MNDKIYICSCGNYNRLQYTDSPEDGYYCICPKCNRYHFEAVPCFYDEEDEE